MSEGFLGRWSRRKEAVREGRAVEPEPPPEPAVLPVAKPPACAPGAEPAAEAERPPAPTLEDVQALTPESDFSRFVAPEVAPEVKNAAMKKLFADPHFNAMDGLDVYIDDYGKPDPLPASMARQLASAQFLKLFQTDEEKAAQGSPARVIADNPGAASVAQSQTDEQAVPPPNTHADPDLRLQQDDAPGRQGAGERAE